MVILDSKWMNSKLIILLTKTFVQYNSVHKMQTVFLIGIFNLSVFNSVIPAVPQPITTIRRGI